MAQAPISALHRAVTGIPFEWLRERRWFSSKGQTLESLHVADWGELRLESPAIMALVVARYASGAAEQYLLPLVATLEPHSGKNHVPAATSFVDSGHTYFAHDAFQFEEFQQLLMKLLIEGGELPLQRGRMTFAPTERLKPSPPLQRSQLVAAEQSNSSIIYDRTAILKCFRRVVAGVNPDVEVSRFLTQRAGFPHTPAMLGSIAYFDEKGVEHSIGLLQEFVPNKGDAWDHTIEKLAQFLSNARRAGATPTGATRADVPAQTQRLAASQLSEMRQLGTLTGELHLALSSDDQDPDFAPQPLLPDQLESWQIGIRRQSKAILEDLAARAGALPAKQQEAVRMLLDARPRIEQRIAELGALGDADLELTRFHGDYHLGQVLITENGFLVLDFEGEPMRSIDERRAHGCPLKDVAGMLRSFNYAGVSALLANDEVDASSANGKSLHPEAPFLTAGKWISAWEQKARDEFLDGYLGATRGARFLPQSGELLRSAIAVFELEKALYELKYELNNRPDWLLIPLQGILRTI